MDDAHWAPISTRTGRHHHTADEFWPTCRRGGAATTTVLAAREPEFMCVPAASWRPQNRGGCVGAWVRGCVGAWVGRARRAGNVKPVGARPENPAGRQ